MQKRWPIAAAAALATLSVAGCGVTPLDRDPIYQELKANPPMEIPARHLPRLRRDRSSCDSFNEGRANEYMTCWLPFALSEPHVAKLKYFGPGLIRPNMEMLGEHSAPDISGLLPIR